MAAIVATVAGCQFRATTEVAVEASGAGTFALTVGVDEELQRRLSDAGFDPGAAFEEVAAQAPAWDIAVNDGDDGFEVRFATSFDDPDAFERQAASFHAALDPDDGALYRDLALAVEPSGAATFRGRAGVELPTVLGAAGAGIDFDRDDLTALLARSGDEIRARFHLTLPGEPVDHDADEVDGATLTWRLPVGTLRTLHARALAPPGLAPWQIAAAALGVAALAFGAAVALRRRRRARAEVRAPNGTVSPRSR